MKQLFDNNAMILQVQSDLTGNEVKNLVEDTRKLMEEKNGHSEIILDINEVKCIDSIGISFIIGIYKSAVKDGKTFKISGANYDIAQLFRLMKLDEIFMF